MKGSVFQHWLRLSHRIILVVLSGYLAGAESAPAQQARPVTGPAPDVTREADAAEPAGNTAPNWTAADTKLANHYIRMLEQNPEYGNVLDLLWDLYAKKDQTELLLEYIGGAATGEEGTLVAKTLFAHLLRKNEEADRAREFYGGVLEADPENVIALRGAAEIADQQQRSAKALAFYTRLAELTPIESEDGVAFRLRRAALLKQSEQLEGAVAIWNQLLEAWPGNTALRTEIVSLLMEAGRTDDAIAVLESLAAGQDPQLQLTSLKSLSRLYQFIGDFDGSVETIRKGMALLHFKHHEHDGLYTRLVRLHERFGKLGELEAQLEADASRENPSEKAVFLMVEFYRLTANPDRQGDWAARLSEIVPSHVDYKVELAAIRMANDQYEEAAAVLDKLIAAQPNPPLHLILQRIRVALNLEGREKAESHLRDYLEGPVKPTSDTLEEVLAFAQEHYLDGMVEHLLRGPLSGELAGNEGESAPVELARFLRERGRTGQAEATLRDYVEEAGTSDTLRASRLNEVSAVFRDLGLGEDALSAIDEAIALAPENLEYRIKRGDIQIDQKNIEGALATFETVWEKSPDLKSRTEIDQRIFSLLRGQIDPNQENNGRSPLSVPSGRIQNMNQFRNLSAAANASRPGREADEPPPEKLVEFYDAIKTAASTTPSLQTRYRAAWWAFKLQDFTETWEQLNKAQAEAPQPVVEVEKMLFDLAEQNERHSLMAKHLETLAKIDPENAPEYRQRWAEVRFLVGYEDEAIRVLEELATAPDASLNTLKTLASLYQRQGRTVAQIRVWEDAYRRANLFEKRRIIKQLSTTFIELDKAEDALKAQLDLLRRETDLVQKRKQFDSQLSVASRHFHLPWLRDRYLELAQQNPFDRFYTEALARIYRAEGKDEDAFLAMKRAYYMSGQDRELLAELGELAARTKDLKSAIYYHRQLIAQNEGGADAESWQSLIDMLDRDLRVPEADQMRRRLEGKFAQDADFLTRLAKQYRESGLPADAERVLDQLTSLRPWDAGAWFELGLLRKESGGADSGQALEAFEKALEATAEAALPADAKRLTHFPIAIQPGATGNASPGLPDFATAVRDHPAVGPDQHDKIIDWLNVPRSEWSRVPGKKMAIRLRAIEEAARIHARTEAGRKEWIGRWSTPDDQSPTERFWALFHAGEKDQTFALLEKYFLPAKSPVDRFLFSLLALRLDRTDALLVWAEEDAALRHAQEGDRHHFLFLAANVLIQNPGDTEQAEQAGRNLQILLKALPEHYRIGWHLFNRTRQNNPEVALSLGEILAAGSPLGRNGDFLYTLAKTAEGLARDEAYRKYLRQSLDVMESNDDPGLPISYFPAVTEYHALLQSTDKQLEFLTAQRQRMEASPAAPEWVRHEHRALMALVSRNAEVALDAIGDLFATSRPLDRIIPRRFNFEPDLFSLTENWVFKDQIFRRFAQRQLPGMDPLTFHEATGAGGVPAPVQGDDETRDEFEKYEIERLVWLLEKLTPPERHRWLAELYSQLRYPSSRMELPNLLEARGLHREAIPVYRQLIVEDPDDISPLRGFFGACRKAQDFRPALELIQSYFDQELHIPKSVTMDYLTQNHAEFLYMARDVETLTALAQDPARREEGGSNRLPGNALIADGQNPWRYHDALIRVLEQRGQPEALLRTLEHLRERGHVAEKDRLLAGRMARREGRDADAIEWLDKIQFDQQQVLVETEAIRELADLYVNSDPPLREKLAGLARSALDYEDGQLIRDLAAKLYEAGARMEARSCLLLHARKRATGPAERSASLDRLIRLELENGAGFAAVSDELKNLAENLHPSDIAGAGRFLALITEFGPAEKEGWLDLLVPLREKDRTHLVGSIGAAILENRVATLAPSFFLRYRDEAAEISRALELLAPLGDGGKIAARELLDRWPENAWTLMNGNPVRLVRVFGLLNDDIRAADLQARLLLECQSDLFHRFNLANFDGNFLNRLAVPQSFVAAGFPDLAGALFRRYHDGFPRLTHEHVDFIHDYTRFLIDRKAFADAENVLAPALQKSIGTDPELLVTLYDAWDRLDETDDLVKKLYLPSGMLVRIEELRAEREAGGE